MTLLQQHKMLQLASVLLSLMSFYSGVCLDIAEPFGRVNCKESKVDRNVTLAEGRNAGRFLRANKSITSMKQCVSQCCGIGDCDLAFMINKDCYSVICDSLESCAPKQNDEQSRNTLVAYVARKYRPKYLEQTDGGEPAVTDELEAEYIEENPFSFDEDDVTAAETSKLHHKRNEVQVRDLILAVGCGLVAVMVGVAGVILMTKKLIEDESRGLAYDWMSTKRESAGM